jgi:hypothetical protein
MVHTSRSKAFLSKHHGIAQLSARRLLVLRHGPSARLQGVAIVAQGHILTEKTNEYCVEGAERRKCLRCKAHKCPMFVAMEEDAPFEPRVHFDAKKLVAVVRTYHQKIAPVSYHYNTEY